MKFEWEKINYLEMGYYIRTWRAKVIGGWVMRTECWGEDAGQSESSVFIPDAEHKWEIDEE